MARSEGAHVTYLLTDVTMESAAATVHIADIMVHSTQIAALMHAVNATPQQRYAFVRNGQTLADAIAATAAPANGVQVTGVKLEDAAAIAARITKAAKS